MGVALSLSWTFAQGPKLSVQTFPPSLFYMGPTSLKNKQTITMKPSNWKEIDYPGEQECFLCMLISSPAHLPSNPAKIIRAVKSHLEQIIYLSIFFCSPVISHLFTIFSKLLGSCVIRQAFSAEEKSLICRLLFTQFLVNVRSRITK